MKFTPTKLTTNRSEGKSSRLDAEVSPTIRVATGSIHLPLMTLLRVEDQFYVCTHEKLALPCIEGLRIPTLKGVQHDGNLSYLNISEDKYNIIRQAIYKHEVVQDYHINSCTFLYTWCLSKGLDLFVERVLKK